MHQYHLFERHEMKMHQGNKRSVIFFGTALPILFLGIYFLVAGAENLSFQNAVINVEALPTASISGIEQKIFGYSTKGRPIEGYVFGKGEHALFLFGSIHGNEMGTADLVNQLINEIKDNPGLVAEDKKLVIIPIMNPDGYYDRTDKLNANGVNLNLNFPTTDWKQWGDSGTFAGVEPFTEVESRLLRDIVNEYMPDAMISFHSKGALVSPEEGEESIALGKWYAEKTGYEYFDEWDFAGTATRWFWEMRHMPAITVELTDYLESDWNINKDALLELISANEKVW